MDQIQAFLMVNEAFIIVFPIINVLLSNALSVVPSVKMAGS
jgi:hypothetical protein